jgi:hypothetical protein
MLKIEKIGWTDFNGFSLKSEMYLFSDLNVEKNKYFFDIFYSKN